MRKYEKIDKKLDLFNEKQVRENAKGNENIVEFARRLCVCLDSNGLNESDLVRKTGIGKASINAYIKGEQMASIDKLVIIAKKLNVSTDYLLGLTKYPTVKEDYKKVQKITGLSEKAIDILKSQLNYHSEAIKNNEAHTIFKDGIDTISFLIENEEKYSLFKNLYNFLWFDINHKDLVDKKTTVTDDDYGFTYTIDMVTSLTKITIDRTLFNIKKDIENKYK